MSILPLSPPRRCRERPPPRIKDDIRGHERSRVRAAKDRGRALDTIRVLSVIETTTLSIYSIPEVSCSNAQCHCRSSEDLYCASWPANQENYEPTLISVTRSPHKPSTSVVRSQTPRSARKIARPCQRVAPPQLALEMNIWADREGARYIRSLKTFLPSTAHPHVAASPIPQDGGENNLQILASAAAKLQDFFSSNDVPSIEIPPPPQSDNTRRLLQAALDSQTAAVNNILSNLAALARLTPPDSQSPSPTKKGAILHRPDPSSSHSNGGSTTAGREPHTGPLSPDPEPTQWFLFKTRQKTRVLDQDQGQVSDNTSYDRADRAGAPPPDPGPAHKPRTSYRNRANALRGPPPGPPPGFSDFTLKKPYFSQQPMYIGGPSNPCSYQLRWPEPYEDEEGPAPPGAPRPVQKVPLELQWHWDKEYQQVLATLQPPGYTTEESALELWLSRSQAKLNKGKGRAPEPRQDEQKLTPLRLNAGPHRVVDLTDDVGEEKIERGPPPSPRPSYWSPPSVSPKSPPSEEGGDEEVEDEDVIARGPPPSPCPSYRSLPRLLPKLPPSDDEVNDEEAIARGPPPSPRLSYRSLPRLSPKSPPSWDEDDDEEAIARGPPPSPRPSYGSLPRLLPKPPPSEDEVDDGEAIARGPPPSPRPGYKSLSRLSPTRTLSQEQVDALVAFNSSPAASNIPYDDDSDVSDISTDSEATFELKNQKKHVVDRGKLLTETVRYHFQVPPNKFTSDSPYQGMSRQSIAEDTFYFEQAEVIPYIERYSRAQNCTEEELENGDPPYFEKACSGTIASEIEDDKRSTYFADEYKFRKIATRVSNKKVEEGELMVTEYHPCKARYTVLQPRRYSAFERRLDEEKRKAAEGVRDEQGFLIPPPAPSENVNTERDRRRAKREQKRERQLNTAEGIARMFGNKDSRATGRHDWETNEEAREEAEESLIEMDRRRRKQAEMIEEAKRCLIETDQRREEQAEIEERKINAGGNTRVFLREESPAPGPRGWVTKQEAREEAERLAKEGNFFQSPQDSPIPSIEDYVAEDNAMLDSPFLPAQRNLVAAFAREGLEELRRRQRESEPPPWGRPLDLDVFRAERGLPPRRYSSSSLQVPRSELGLQSLVSRSSPVDAKPDAMFFPDWKPKYFSRYVEMNKGAKVPRIVLTWAPEDEEDGEDGHGSSSDEGDYHDDECDCADCAVFRKDDEDEEYQLAIALSLSACEYAGDAVTEGRSALPDRTLIESAQLEDSHSPPPLYNINRQFSEATQDIDALRTSHGLPPRQFRLRLNVPKRVPARDKDEDPHVFYTPVRKPRGPSNVSRGFRTGQEDESVPSASVNTPTPEPVREGVSGEDEEVQKVILPIPAPGREVREDVSGDYVVRGGKEEDEGWEM